METAAGETENILPQENILGISDQFVERSGYYYYKNVLENEAYAEAFQKIRIPEEWDEEKSESIGGEFEVRIEADAIQSSHITPDFDSEYPWGETQDIQKHRDGAMCRAKYVKAEEGPELTILFEDGSDKLFVKPEDFFSGFPKVLPGDVYEEMIHLKNNGNYDETLYFKMDVEKEKMERAEWDLLQKIVLKVVKKPSKGENVETILYQGALGGSAKRTGSMEYTRLLDMKKNSQEELVFSLDIPKELDNVFSDRNVKIHWYFSLKDHEKLVERKGVQTGDNAQIIIWCIGCGMSLGILGFVLLMKKRKGGLR